MMVFRYFDDFEKKIPRDEIKRIESKLKETLLNYDKDYLISVCGSYR